MGSQVELFLEEPTNQYLWELNSGIRPSIRNTCQFRSSEDAGTCGYSQRYTDYCYAHSLSAAMICVWSHLPKSKARKHSLCHHPLLGINFSSTYMVNVSDEFCQRQKIDMSYRNAGEGCILEVYRPSDIIMKGKIWHLPNEMSTLSKLCLW